MIGIIYRTTCLITFDKYIGKHACKSTSFDGYLGSGKHLKRAIDKYGKNNFIRQIIRVVDDDEDIDELERYYIRINDAVNRSDYYNIQEGGEGLAIGYVPSEETRKKMIENHADVRGNKNPHYGVPKKEGTGTPPKKCCTKEHPDIIFNSRLQAELISKSLGWTGVNQSHVAANILGKRNYCGKDENGTPLHWEDVL